MTEGLIVEADSEHCVVVVEYDPQSPDPSRVFRSIALMIDALHSTDRDLLASVGVDAEPTFYLERVESGSVRAVLRTALLATHDDALKNLNWKPLIGQYLVRAKHKMLHWLGERDSIGSRAEVTQLQNELIADAPQVLPMLLAPIPAERLLFDLQRISEAARQLGPADAIQFQGSGEVSSVNTHFLLTSERIGQLLTSRVVSSESELVLLVKRPDYLGRSRWEFRRREHVIEARIDDLDWLDRFQP